MLTALFGITDDSLSLAVNVLLLVLVVVWIALVWWTYTDAKRRIGDPILVVTATAASLFPFIGTVVYSILRPPEFLADARERELETRAAELRLRQLFASSCPRCEYPIELSWLRCPECRHRLKDPCRSCGRPVDPEWSVCPVCETAVGAAPPAQAREQQPERRPPRARTETTPEPERTSERPAPEQRPASRVKAQRQAAVTQQPKRRTAASPSSDAKPRQQPARKPSTAKPATSDPAPDDDGGGSPQRPPRRKPTPRT